MTAQLWQLPPDQQRQVLALAAVRLKHKRQSAWQGIARPEQKPPDGDWRTWLILAGRGWGKTRTGAETVAQFIRDGSATRVGVVAQTAADARDVSVRALVAASPGAVWEPSKRLVTFPNGATAITFSAEDPDSLRGYEFDLAWSDELAAWRFPEAWDQLQYGLRVGRARQIVTTTPRPVRVIRALLDDPSCTVTRGRTLDNEANLSAEALAYLLRKYAGTRLGRQELDAEILDDVPGALWQRSMFDARRSARDMSRVVVAIDPAATSNEDSDETGIVVAGLGIDGFGYVLADRSCRASPADWASRAIAAFREFKADRIVAEDNNGGEMVELTLRTVDSGVPIKRVHASRGKHTRAEPVASLYEQGRVFQPEPMPDLEDQLCSWTPDDVDSPDRLDALVWALTELMVKDPGNPWSSLAGKPVSFS